MASPAVAAVVEGGLTSANANMTITLPGGGSASDMYLVIVAKGSVSNTVNALAGWTEIVDDGAAAGIFAAYYTGGGVPSNPTFVQSAASRSVWCAYRITGANLGITPDVSANATGTSTAPNATSATVTGGPKDVLAITCFAQNSTELADDDTLVTTFPTNYTDGQVEKTGGTTGTNLAGLLGAAARQITGASSEDAGAFTSILNAAWRARTILVHPAAAAAPVKRLAVLGAG